MITNYYLFWNH